MQTDEGQSVGRKFAESYIKSRVPEATNFSWTDECVPPNLDYDFEIVSFQCGGGVRQIRLRCDSVDHNNEADIRSWVNAQMAGW